MINTIGMNKENFFIVYDKVMKNPDAQILIDIMTHYKDQYEEFIHTESIGKLSDEEILGLCIQSTERNILKFVAKKEFDYDRAYTNLHRIDRNKELYTKSHELTIYNTLEIIQKQNFTKTICIYSPEYDQRIYDDIKNNIPHSNRVDFICGGFITAVREFPQTTAYILPDIEMVKLLIEEDLVDGKLILLANYGFNYKRGENNTAVIDIDGDIEEIMKEKNFHMTIFSPSGLFNMIDNGTMQKLISINDYLEKRDENADDTNEEHTD